MIKNETQTQILNPIKKKQFNKARLWIFLNIQQRPPLK